VCENGWPDGILGIGRFWHNPEALVGVVMRVTILRLVV